MQFRRSRTRLNSLVANMIASRRALSPQQLEERGDLLSILMAARDEEGTGVGMSDTQLRVRSLPSSWPAMRR